MEDGYVAYRLYVGIDVATETFVATWVSWLNVHPLRSFAARPCR